MDLEDFAPKPIPDSKVFLMVSRLLIEKGVYEFIKAASLIKRKYPNVIFRLIGGVTSNKYSLIDKNFLRHYIDIGVIEYLGEIPFHEVKKEIAKCRYFVLPSYREGTPRSVLEALGVGRPIITTDTVGCRETVIKDLNGKLVKPRNVNDLAEKMKLLLNLSHENLIKMGDESIKLAKEKYDVNKVNKQILKILFK